MIFQYTGPDNRKWPSMIGEPLTGTALLLSKNIFPTYTSKARTPLSTERQNDASLIGRKIVLNNLPANVAKIRKIYER